MSVMLIFRVCTFNNYVSFCSMNVSLDDLDESTNPGQSKPVDDGQEAVISMSTQQQLFPLDLSDDTKLFPHDSEFESLGSPDIENDVHGEDKVPFLNIYVNFEIFEIFLLQICFMFCIVWMCCLVFFRKILPLYSLQ